MSVDFVKIFYPNDLMKLFKEILWKIIEFLLYSEPIIYVYRGRGQITSFGHSVPVGIKGSGKPGV